MSPIRCLFLFLTLPNVISTLHILFYILLLGKSHIDFTDSLIDALVENGHTVDLIIARMNSHVTTNGSARTSRIYSYGFKEESPWSKTPHLLDPFKEKVRSWKEHVHYMEIATELCEIGLSDPGLHQFLANQKYDIGIATEYDYCGFALMKYYSIPSIVSVSSMAILDQQSVGAGMPNSAAVTQALFEPEDLSTWLGKLKNLINWTHINFIIYPYCRRIQSKSINKYLGDQIDAQNLMESIDIQFLNSNELIELPRVVTPKIKFIGGINLRKSKGILADDVESLISGGGGVKEGIVVFCFGTQVASNLFPIEVRHAFAAAFRQFPEFTFVWKYELQEGDQQIFANTTNLKFLKWLPQTDLLNDPRTRAFISHTGLNSYLESSYAGVPILAIPLFADQPHNAKSGESIGTTYVLDKTQLTTHNIVKGLKAVLYDTSYILNSKRISKMLQDRPNPPKSIFVEWVEFAARNPLLHRNLNLPGQKMTVIEYYCIDLILVWEIVTWHRADVDSLRIRTAQNRNQYQIFHCSELYHNVLLRFSDKGLEQKACRKMDNAQGIRGDTCDLTYRMAYRDEVDAKEFCSKTCQSGWIMMLGYCYQMPEKHSTYIKNGTTTEGMPKNAQINPNIKLQVLCEYQASMTPAEINYLGRRYSEIYYPSIPVDNGVLIRSASSYTSSSNQLEICQKTLKLYHSSDVGVYIPDKKTLNAIAQKPLPLILHSRSSTIDLTEKSKLDEVLCSPRDMKLKVAMKSSVIQLYFLDEFKISSTCQNMGSTGITHSLKSTPQLLAISDSRSHPIWCKLGAATRPKFAVPDGYSVFRRKNGQYVAHALIQEYVYQPEALSGCKARGAILSGMESMEEGAFLENTAKLTKGNQSFGICWADGGVQSALKRQLAHAPKTGCSRGLMESAIILKPAFGENGESQQTISGNTDAGLHLAQGSVVI